jgi:hypothetical protein
MRLRRTLARSLAIAVSLTAVIALAGSTNGFASSKNAAGHGALKLSGNLVGTLKVRSCFFANGLVEMTLTGKIAPLTARVRWGLLMYARDYRKKRGHQHPRIGLRVNNSQLLAISDVGTIGGVWTPLWGSYKLDEGNISTSVLTTSATGASTTHISTTAPLSGSINFFFEGYYLVFKNAVPSDPNLKAKYSRNYPSVRVRGYFNCPS